MTGCPILFLLLSGDVRECGDDADGDRPGEQSGPGLEPYYFIFAAFIGVFAL
jgi:hypothetical protein